MRLNGIRRFLEILTATFSGTLLRLSNCSHHFPVTPIDMLKAFDSMGGSRRCRCLGVMAVYSTGIALPPPVHQPSKAPKQHLR
jgi:hypothetical protein